MLADSQKGIMFARVRNTGDGRMRLQEIYDPDQEEQGHNESESWNLVDLSRPLEQDCELTFADFNDSKQAFWHSSAHILGSALE